MKPYLDTNFLLRLYLDFEESGSALEKIAGLPGRTRPCPITWLNEIELANALQLVVYQMRRGSGQRLTPEMSAVAFAEFDADLGAGRGLARATLPYDELTRAARQLSARHTASGGYRAYDIIHVASALCLRCDSFWSYDAKASGLANAEGLKTL
jgi:predicted nucleic acid-binding protein